ncbi:hypothetical protein C8U37_10849 [Trichococcus patagoniensis]|uniref:Damage-control phosphatase ARMT1-like metal-binding domain-containing protein n=1 Tax=Trichococcus patagoniensis TaxID=382641 RepID=A0A2T5IKY0_9LACT|nr:ARMT1-like domain-containing protein [Trichococcus patagoniensis]PTQ84482.1 hypothetical protein C8U37_10849 [Trichococcus patagoniensis]
MELYLDCLPCMLKQVLEATRLVTNDTDLQEKILCEAFNAYSDNKPYRYAPEVCEDMHAVVKKYTESADPYANIKSSDIQTAFSLEPTLVNLLEEAIDPMVCALKISATGNVMDSALYSSRYLESFLIEELEMPFVISDEGSFKKDLEKAKTILIIGDNAGEAVFDKLLARFLAVDHQVIYAVRDAAIINDVTIEEALRVGMDNVADIVSTGCGAPGAVLESCSEAFLEVFNTADIVISKGQGNYEALSDASRKIFFLLKAKCPKIAKSIGVTVNDYVFKYNGKRFCDNG